MTDIAEKDIIKKSEWPSDSRMTLINFLEDYQTAYALKRLDYLTKIYSDDVLIIVGHVVKRTKIPDDKVHFNLPEEEVSQMKEDKHSI